MAAPQALLVVVPWFIAPDRQGGQARRSVEAGDLAAAERHGIGSLTLKRAPGDRGQGLREMLDDR